MKARMSSGRRSREGYLFEILAPPTAAHGVGWLAGARPCGVACVHLLGTAPASHIYFAAVLDPTRSIRAPACSSSPSASRRPLRPLRTLSALLRTSVRLLRRGPPFCSSSRELSICRLRCFVRFAPHLMRLVVRSLTLPSAVPRAFAYRTERQLDSRHEACCLARLGVSHSQRKRSAM